MKRVVVIGSGGAGKSTFSRQLGEITDIEVIHLDNIYWQPNWVKTPEDEWREVVAQLLPRDSWIMDGNFGGTRELRMCASDTVIFLDIPRRVCLYRILKRAVLYRNKRRPDMAEGCNERFDWDFIKWVWNYPRRSKVRMEAELQRLQNKKVIRLRSTQEINDFLRDLSKSTRA